MLPLLEKNRIFFFFFDKMPCCIRSLFLKQGTPWLSYLPPLMKGQSWGLWVFPTSLQSGPLKDGKQVKNWHLHCLRRTLALLILNITNKRGRCGELQSSIIGLREQLSNLRPQFWHWSWLVRVRGESWANAKLPVLFQYVAHCIILSLWCYFSIT